MKRCMIFVSCLALVSALALLLPAGAGASTTAGTIKAGVSIGTVGSPLLGGTLYKGTPATKSGQAWYQLDKAGTKTATIRVKDTSTAGSSCTSLLVDLDNAAGTGGNISNVGLGDDSAETLTVTTAGLYYIEIQGDNCTPTDATTFSINPEPSTAWASPTPPTSGTATAGLSIGRVGSPLLGGMLYKGTPAIKSGQAWYQLDKTGSKTATIRVEDTAVNGSTSCTSLLVDLDNAAGTDGIISNVGLGDDSAETLTVTTAGLYYVEIQGDNCTPTDATTFSINPEPSTAWASPTPPTSGTATAGLSIGTLGSPLLGGTLYKGTPATSSGQAWYQLDKTGSKTATIRIEDTAVNGSTSCTSLLVDLDNSAGTGGNISNVGLGDDSAENLTVTTAGLYYVEIQGDNCTPTDATTFSINPEPSTPWASPAPPSVGKVKAGDSMATVGAPLRGGKLYPGSPATSSGEAWYQLHKTGTETATIRIEDTAVNGSTGCTSILVDLDNGSGGNISNVGLGDDSAENLPVTTAGLYYIEIQGDNCTPTTATTYSINPEPSSAWATSAPETDPK